MTDEPINTLETPGEFDALVKLRPNEPYFMLIGRDRLAPPLVDEWADKNRRRALADHQAGLIDREKLELELRQSTQAEMQGCAMRAYKAGVEADEAAGQASLSYTGHELPEETERRDRQQRSRARSVAALHNAIAEINDAAAVFRETGDVDALATCTGSIDVLKAIAEALAPKRPGIEKAAA